MRLGSELTYAELRQLTELLARSGVVDYDTETVDLVRLRQVVTTAQTARRHCVWCGVAHHDVHPFLCEGCQTQHPNLKDGRT